MMVLYWGKIMSIYWNHLLSFVQFYIILLISFLQLAWELIFSEVLSSLRADLYILAVEEVASTLSLRDCRCCIFLAYFFSSSFMLLRYFNSNSLLLLFFKDWWQSSCCFNLPAFYWSNLSFLMRTSQIFSNFTASIALTSSSCFNIWDLAYFALQAQRSDSCLWLGLLGRAKIPFDFSFWTSVSYSASLLSIFFSMREMFMDRLSLESSTVFVSFLSRQSSFSFSMVLILSRDLFKSSLRICFSFSAVNSSFLLLNSAIFLTLSSKLFCLFSLPFCFFSSILPSNLFLLYSPSLSSCSCLMRIFISFKLCCSFLR